MKSDHKSSCMIHRACAADHHGAPCPGPYGQCDYGLEKPSTVEVGHAQFKDDLIDETIEKCIGLFCNDALRGSYAAPRESFSKILSDLYAKAEAVGREDSDVCCASPGAECRHNHL